MAPTPGGGTAAAEVAAESINSDGTRVSVAAKRRYLRQRQQQNGFFWEIVGVMGMTTLEVGLESCAGSSVMLKRSCS